MFRLLSLCVLLASVPHRIAAEDLPLEPTRTITFTTDEGTWMSVDVAPDGKTILFDLVGDLYTLPITGGRATRLTSGMAFDATPRYSPDGKRIAFMSDRSGRTQLWVVEADGSAPRQVTRGMPVVGWPIWTPDGQALVAVQGEALEAIGIKGIWRYDITSGSGASLLPETLPFPGHDSIATVRYLSPPTIHPDGKTMWFSEWVTSLREAERLSALRVVDLVTRTAAPVVTPDGNGSRPTLSRDGRWLAYFAVQTKPHRTVLRIRDVSRGPDGSDRLVAVVEPQPMTRVSSSYPSYAFTPDSRAVILASAGKLVRVDVAGGRVTPIPFTAHVTLDLGSTVHVPRKLDDGPLAVRKLSGVSRSPDGDRLVFAAVGKIWMMRSGKKPSRLTSTDGAVREHDPVFSLDGRWIAFASWSNAEGGRLWKMPAEGGTPVPLTNDPSAYYSVPRWTPGGTRVVFVAAPDYQADTAFGARHPTKDAMVSWVNATGGSVHAVGSIPSLLQYDRRTFDYTVRGNPARAYYMNEQVLTSVGLDARDVRVELTIDPGKSQVEWIRAVPSPDGMWLAMMNDLEIVALPWPRCAGAASCIVRLDDPSTLVAVSEGGGIQPSWSVDGTWLSWVRANTVFRVRTADLTRKAARLRPESLSVDLQVPRPGGSGHLLLRGARLVTMASRGIVRKPTPDEGVSVTTDPVVIEKGDLLIENHRIAALGPSGTVRVPRDAKVIDVSGKTIIPGLIDLHADALGYGARYANTIAWDGPANLAYGVTTARNPGVQHFDIGELIESGTLLGPRFFGILRMNDRPIRSLAEARQRMRAPKNVGADWIKAGTNHYSRAGQQWTIMAAGLEGIGITNHWYEGTVQDGNSGVEHSRFQDQNHRLHRDWVELIARAGTTWTPTMVVAFRDPVAFKMQDTLYQRFERCADFASPKLRRFLPPLTVAKYDGGEDRLPCDPAFGIGAAVHAARSARDVVRAGGNVAASSHGNSFEGILMMHWELEVMVAGGMTPAEALRAGTLNGARGLGLDADLGSLEVGKIADLVVLDRNPLENIRHTLAIRHVMQRGILYDGETLDRVWPSAEPSEGNPW